MNWLGWLKALLFMNCREAAPLIAQGMDRKLAAPDRTAVRAHLAICRSCRRYRGQLRLIRRVLMLIGPIQGRPGAGQLPPEARTRIESRIVRVLY